VLVIGVLFKVYNGEQTHSVNQPSTQSSADQPAKNNGGWRLRSKRASQLACSRDGLSN